MSQYLSHFANLAFNHVDVVQPRLASRFENQNEPLAESHLEPEVVSGSPRAVAQSHDQQPQSSHQTSGIPQHTSIQPVIENIYPTEIRIQETPAIKPIQTPPPLNQVSHTRESVTQILPVQTREFVTQTVPVQTPLAKQPSPTVMFANNTIIERHIEQISTPAQNSAKVIQEISIPDAKPEHLHPMVIREPAKHLLTREDDKTEPKIIEKREAVSDPIKPSSIRVKQVQIEPLIAPPITYSKTLRAEVDVTPPPTINVSIGRIEIRASQSNSPAPTKSRAASGMSLDDYLKQRNGDKP